MLSTIMAPSRQANPVLYFAICMQAFPCIATGIYGYPNEDAAHIALKTTKEWLQAHKDEVCVYVNVCGSIMEYKDIN